ncbi:chromosome segregation protein SMC [Corallococcus sp. AB018]|uniref:AAA family ATPase n=1 Tax=unclassified Corallococcus TaxID=2685029 RepID=UPI000EA13C50|nr:MULTISPECIES: AAA family ATPase [unclassified Corallococcus]RKH18422.1 chromosome segregation protein SMC [Corallococcus sp. CA041A]RUO88982.1 chromosome segregation protein SMC [Corallococcus sp. AB018]
MPSAESPGPSPNPQGRRPPLLSRVTLRNFRSIEACDVALGPLTFLVGPNGSGKSNFLDALRLITDALRTSLDSALRSRGGAELLVHHSNDNPNRFDIRLDFHLPDGACGHYSVGIGVREFGEHVVEEEECSIGTATYHVRRGVLLVKPNPVAPPATEDRLYLVNASGLPEFRPIFDALSAMGFYHLNPDQLRAPQPPDKGELLARDGSNLPSVLDRLTKRDATSTKDRIEDYLKAIVPNLEAVNRGPIGHMETLIFLQKPIGTNYFSQFPAINMSDGSLRALGILVAMFQPRSEPKIQLIGIEEPEIALHPAAAGVLRDALRDASQYAQIIVTSHSPDLLDDSSIHGDEILSVVSEQGRSLIAKVDEATRSALKDRLYTAGELLKANQLSPDREAIPQPDLLKLWEHDA